MNITKDIRKTLNRIAMDYSKWLTPKELVTIYNRLNALGVVVPCWGYWDGNSHPFTIDGKEVENSLFVFVKYSDENISEVKDEYLIYFS